MGSLFSQPIENLKLVGEQRAKMYHRLGIHSIGELIRFYPRDYEDWSKPTDIFSALVGETACLRLCICDDVEENRAISGRIITTCSAYDDTGVIKLTFFNNKYIKYKLKEGEEYFVYGKLKESFGKKEMLSPSLSPVSEEIGLHPLYPLTSGLSQRMVQANVKDALSLLPKELNDPIPLCYREKYNLMGLKEALQKIHFPNNESDLLNARKRLVFEELLVLNLGLKNMKNQRREETSYIVEKDCSRQYFSSLPFVPTNAQLKAVNECISDMMHGKYPMNRLLQGDVGSGKTAVATALCHTVIKNGFQCAFMAPTEILAAQHYKNISAQLAPLGIKTELLTGSTPAKEKRRILSELASGEIGLVTGTHALISDNVEFSRLALVITDEQHRFGVSQRAKLISKGENPHLLVMSATPIPRTLALIMYGDLDISVLDEMPKGRIKIDTLSIDSSKRARACGFIRKQLDEGRQCYIVCPCIEEGEGELESVIKYAEKMAQTEFKGYNVGLLHGKLASGEKEAIMKRFSGGEIDVLISTTVVEVGVDVKNASVMMIENAERFGLSQLHQLRGRVGRGNYKSYCILISDSRGGEAKRRMKIMCQTDSGFKIADEDLKLRGPGDFFGAKQHGLPKLTIASLSDMDTIEITRQAADEICEGGINKPEYSSLRGEMKRLFGMGGERLN